MRFRSSLFIILVVCVVGNATAQIFVQQVPDSIRASIEIVPPMPHNTSQNNTIDEEPEFYPSKIKDKYKCPIDIVDTFLTFNSIGVPEIHIGYINVTKKIIDAVEISVFCYNNFNEPVAEYNHSNIFHAIDQDEVNSGYKMFSTWTMNLFDNTTKFRLKVIRVHFNDGKIWVGK